MSTTLPTRCSRRWARVRGTVFASTRYALSPGQEIEILRSNSTAGLLLRGNEFTNQVQGGAGNDILVGAADGTRLQGGGGVLTTFVAGDGFGGFNQIWGGASLVSGVAGHANNTLSFASPRQGV